MSDDEEALQALCDPTRLMTVDPNVRSNLLSALLVSLSSEPVSVATDRVVLDMHPLDLPIRYSKDSQTGDLYLRLGYPMDQSPGLAANVVWREVRVTPSAQACLLMIFDNSLREDQAAGRALPAKTHFQSRS